MAFRSRLGTQPLRLSRPWEEGLYSPVGQATEEDTIEQILRYGGSALAGAGNLLDYVGGAARGGLADITDLLQGNSYEGHTLDSLFSDPTSSEHRVSGRDLAEQWGLAGENDMSWIPDTGDVAGFGIEVLTDPLTYATFGALTAGGKAAQMAGKGAKTFGQAVKAGERSLLGLGSPFSQEAAVNLLGKGTIGENIAEGISKAGNIARYGKIPGTNISPGQRLASLFSPFDAHTPEVGQSINGVGPTGTGVSLQDALETGDMGVRENTTRWLGERKALGLTDEESQTFSDYIGGAIERRKWVPGETTGGTRLWDWHDDLGSALSPNAKALADQQATEYMIEADRIRQSKAGMGLSSGPPVTAGGFRYRPRQAVDMIGESHQIGRQAQLEDLATPFPSLEDVTPSMDDASFRGGDPLLMLFKTDFIGYTFESGDNLEATIQLPRIEMFKGRNANVYSARIDGDMTAATLHLDGSRTIAGSQTRTTSTDFRANGDLPIRAEGRYIQPTVVLGAAASWSFAFGLELEGTPGGRH